MGDFLLLRLFDLSLEPIFNPLDFFRLFTDVGLDGCVSSVSRSVFKFMVTCLGGIAMSLESESPALS